MPTTTKPKKREESKPTELEELRFALVGREWDRYEQNRFTVASRLHDAAADGLIEPLEGLERAIGVANSATDRRTVAWEERAGLANVAALEEESAREAYEALASGADPDLDGRGAKVAAAARRVEELDAALRIGDQVLASAIRSVLATVQPEPILRVLNAGVARLYAEAVEAVKGFPAGASAEEIMRGSPSGVEAFQRLDKAAAGYGRLREIFGAFTAVGGYDTTAGPAAWVYAESTDPIEAETFATPQGGRVRRPGYEPSITWPDSSEFTAAQRTAATCKRLEIFARAGVPPWCPAPDEFRAAFEAGGVTKPATQTPAWVGRPGAA